MPRNGSGTFVLPAGNPVTTGTTISSTWANTTLSDISSALTTSISSDGQTTPTANLPMGGFAHTGVANASVRTQYASAAQVQDGALEYLGAVSGTDTITASAAVGMSAYTVGQTFRFVSAGANTTTAVTININGIGAKNITKNGATALAVGDIISGAALQIVYDGTQFQVTGIAGGVSSFSAGSTGLTPSTATNGAVTLAGTLASTNGGTGLTTFTAANNALYSTAAGTLTAGILPVAAGGTGIQPVTATVASNALTVGINATSLQFRSATLTTGVPTTALAVGALSLVVPSTATLGTVNAVQSQLVLVVLYNGGTPALGIVNISGGTNLDETTLLSTTAMTTGANSASVVYSASAITSSPFRVVGTVVSTQATAGTWATTPSLVQGYGGQALAAMSSLGYGQTWQSVTRTSGTTYYNTTSKPIFLSAYANGITTGQVTIAVSGITVVATSYNGAGGGGIAATAIIPVGASYVVTDVSTSTTKTELR